MKSKEELTKLAKDKVFVALLTARHKAITQGREIRNAMYTLRGLMIPVPAELEAAMELNNKHGVSTERALDEIYCWAWQYDEAAYKVCGLE